MKQVGATLLEDVAYQVSEYSGCEDKDQIDPYLALAVPDWTARPIADRWMVGHEWTEIEAVPSDFGGTYRSPDTQWVATVYVRTGVKPKRVVITLVSAAQFTEDN